MPTVRPKALTTPDPDDPDLVGLQIAAKSLPVTRQTLWRWSEMGMIPAVRVGKQWMIRPQDVPGELLTASAQHHRSGQRQRPAGTGRSDCAGCRERDRTIERLESDLREQRDLVRLMLERIPKAS